ncbi:MAG: LamG domain-containing protein [Candidatus Micrarchaeota archaeon]|nr:LamG domain-containing protein [Candidatus Micrarchaeota archaeon]
MPKLNKKVDSRKKTLRIITSQIAIEYILTYGMALLILSAVIAGLFQLHAFTPQQLRAQPGSCSVFRPSGSYTLQLISLVGACTNLPPLFASNEGSAYSRFLNQGNNGKGGGGFTYPSYVSAPALPLGKSGSQGLTITTWVYWYGQTQTNCQGLVASDPSPGSGFALFGYGRNNGACGILWINGSYVKWPSGVNGSLPYQNKWEFVAATYNNNNGNATVYVNGKVFSSAVLSPRDFETSNATVLGADIWPSGSVYPINGIITNVQIYNAPLAQDELAAMYGEGIGGAPINLKNLVGWWPLNGNANDYSGNGNNATAVNVTFTESYATT